MTLFFGSELLRRSATRITIVGTPLLPPLGVVRSTHYYSSEKGAYLLDTYQIRGYRYRKSGKCVAARVLETHRTQTLAERGRRVLLHSKLWRTIDTMGAASGETIELRVVVVPRSLTCAPDEPPVNLSALAFCVPEIHALPHNGVTDLNREL